MTHVKPILHSRRTCLSLLTIGLPAAATAHSGPGAARVLADVRQAAADGQLLHLTLHLTNPGEDAVSVHALHAEGAKGPMQAITIAPRDIQSTSAAWLFDTTIPGEFPNW